MTTPSSNWPAKRAIFGVDVSVTTYDEIVGVIVQAARERRSACVTALAVHGLMTATRNREFQQVVLRFEAAVPDGQPIRFALNLLHDAGLPDRVRGVNLTLKVCERAAIEHVKVYLYGSRAHVVEALRGELTRRFDTLEIVGCEPGVYRTLTRLENEALVERIKASGAGLLLIGLGCPLQEIFADRHRSELAAVQLCIGAAFDVISGTRSSAPLWMQHAGLEWLYRLGQEPGRLWKRYLDTNTRFIARLIVALLQRRTRRGA